MLSLDVGVGDAAARVHYAAWWRGGMAIGGACGWVQPLRSRPEGGEKPGGNTHDISTSARKCDVSTSKQGGTDMRKFLVNALTAIALLTVAGPATAKTDIPLWHA